MSGIDSQREGADGRRRSARRREDGFSALAVIVAVVVMAALAAALALMTNTTHRERQSSVAAVRVRYAAEGIAQEALALLRAQGLDALRGSAGFPRTVGDVGLSLRVDYGDSDATIADDLIRIVGVARHDDAEAGIEVFVRRTPLGNPALLAFGAEATVLDGNSTVDSYDSNLGTWSAQAVNTRNSIPYAGSAAVVGSNGGISMGSNSQVFGDAVAGPGFSTTLLSNAYVSGTRTSAASPVALPAVVVPVLASNGARTVGADQTVTIAAGSYHWTRFDVLSNARVTLCGPATVVIDDWFVDSNSRITFDTSTGPISVYATGDVEVLSNAVLQPASGRPRDLRIQASGVNRRIVLDSNAGLIGQLYAPSSIVELIGNSHVWGSVVGRQLDMDSNGFLSVDVSLPTVAGPTDYTFTPLSWRHLTDVE